MSRYQDLIVWNKAMDLTEAVYKLLADFPKEEKMALTDQIRRAAVSIPSNIAEGHSRNTVGEFKHFLSIAAGSLAELETQLELARRFGYISNEKYGSTIVMSQEVDRLIWSLYRNIVIVEQ